MLAPAAGTVAVALCLAIGAESFGPSPFVIGLIAGVVVYPVALLAGIPAFLALREQVTPTWLNCTLTGVGIGLFAAISALVLMIPGAGGADVLAFLRWLVPASIAGAVGGYVFWLTVFAGLSRIPSAAPA